MRNWGTPPAVGMPPRRHRVFCASLADWLDDEVPVEWRADLLALVHATQNLDWLLLTKRPQRWEQAMIEVECHLARGIEDMSALPDLLWWVQSWRLGSAPENVWVGTSVEDQTRAAERIPELLKIPARVRFLSCEPLLGHVDLFDACFSEPNDKVTFGVNHGVLRFGVDWVICGGESGPNARPMHPDWARSLRNQCAAAGVPFLFKQWGEWGPAVAHLQVDPSSPYVNECRWVFNGKTAGIYETTKQQNLTTPGRAPHSFENGEVIAFKMGKKATGRLLDGIEHNEFPDATNAGR